MVIVSESCGFLAGRQEENTLKTVVVARAGNLSIAGHLAEMTAWLADRDIVPRELVMLHVLHWRVVFRATFDDDRDADLFAVAFG